jgi:hypothetical protein
VHGVGIIAISPIKKGTYVFSPDDDKLLWVKTTAINLLPKEIKRLYQDFCIKKGNKYGCPTRFNKLTPAWFLNHSTNPNVAADSSYRFYALKNIKKGNELTADYRKYSDYSLGHTRFHRTARLRADPWKKVMARVWQAQKKIKRSERTPNPVLLERQRRRR